MFSNTEGYQLLKQKENSSDLDICSNCQSIRHRRSSTITLFVIFILSLGITSVCSSWLLARKWAYADSRSSDSTLSQYANLERNFSLPFSQETIYLDTNETFAREQWMSINIDVGMIALPDSFVTHKGLPTSQRFPWDYSKGIYLLNGHHNLHCIRAIYISLMEFRLGEQQSRRWSHVLHCVESLRQDIICNADDTPRYSTTSKAPESGVGQIRQCRSWEKLEAWAKTFHACYKYINQTADPEVFPQIQRFVFCPEGSPYTEEVRKVFDQISRD